MAFWVVGGGSPLGDDAAVTAAAAAAASSSSASGQAAASYLKRGDHGGRGATGHMIDPNGVAAPSGKRRVVYADGTTAATYNDVGCYGITKRPRLDGLGYLVGCRGQDYQGGGSGSASEYEYANTHASQSWPASPAPVERSGSVQVKNLAFLVIREREPSPPTTPTPPLPDLAPDCRAGFPPPLRTPHSTAVSGLAPVHHASVAMERTQSGLSISSDTSAVQSPCDEDRDCNHHNHPPLLDDLGAARLVRRHVANIKRRRHRDSQHGRILKALINPKSREADFPLDNDALRSIFSAANELFFDNKLTQRVTWDWSHPASSQYQSHIVGTTALRRSARLGGYETLIVLSSPILKDTKYNRRLLISTFLHEMIHSFMFITCGFKARQCGGHTEGFRQIAEVIDEWVGKDYLRLRDMEADLERFIDDEDSASAPLHASGPLTGGSVAQNSCYNYAGGAYEAAWAVSEWQHPDTKEYRTIQAPQPHRPYLSNLSEWEWHDREGFPARGVPPFNP